MEKVTNRYLKFNINNNDNELLFRLSNK